MHAPIGIALVATDGRWLTVNRALCEMIGYSEEELLALTFQDISHPDDLEADLGDVADLVAGRVRAYRIEKRCFHKNGQIVTIQLDVSLLRDKGGEPIHLIAQIQDSTAFRSAHEALFGAHKLAEVTFEAIGEGVIRVDRDGQILTANSSVESLLGVDTGTLAERAFADAIVLLDAHQDKRLDRPMTQVLAGSRRGRVPIFTRLVKTDGRYFSIVDSASPIQDKFGQVQGPLFVFQDISEARQVTDELAHQAHHIH